MRYSTNVPFGSPDTSWKTRYGALSSVPIRVQADVPTGRSRKVTSANVLPGRAAPISARPPTTPPALGDVG